MDAPLTLQPVNRQAVPGLSSRIEDAFKAASSATGVSFDYLLATAQRESSLNPTAKANTSSATGLFQFIESTWLETVHKNGADFGLKNISDQITRRPDGALQVKDAKTKADILALRNDPVISAQMAGALSRDNAAELSAKIGREPTQGELYIAHFMGARGGGDLILTATHAPELNAADVYPKQANANEPIFFNKDGISRTVGEVYQLLISKHGTDKPVERAVAYASPAETLQAFSPDLNKVVLASHFGAMKSAYGSESPMPSRPQLFAPENPESPLFNAAAAQEKSSVPNGNLGGVGVDPSKSFETIKVSALSLTADQLLEPLPLLPQNISQTKQQSAAGMLGSFLSDKPLDLAVFAAHRMREEQGR